MTDALHVAEWGGTCAAPWGLRDWGWGFVCLEGLCVPEAAGVVEVVCGAAATLAGAPNAHIVLLIHHGDAYKTGKTSWSC